MKRTIKSRGLTDPAEIDAFKERRDRLARPEHEPLSVPDEQEAGRRMIAGDQAARMILFNANRRWAMRYAASYSGMADIEDLVQACEIGLWRSLEDWDPEGGARVATWSRTKMSQEIRRVIRGNELVKAPLNDPERLRRVQKIGIDDFAEVLAGDAETGEDAEASELARLIADGLRSIQNETDTEIVCRIHGIAGWDPQTQTEVAEALGITRQRVQQRYQRAIKKLRSGPNAILLELLWRDM